MASSSLPFISNGKVGKPKPGAPYWPTFDRCGTRRIHHHGWQVQLLHQGPFKNLSENSSVLQEQDLILSQASSRNSSRSVEGEVHSGGGRAGKLVHPLHHHLGGVPDPEVCLPSLCFVFLFQIVLYFPSYYVVKVLLTITDCEL